MGTIIYLVLVAICIFFVYNIVDKLKYEYHMQFLESRPLELICIGLLGLLLAGIVKFLLVYILVPLMLIIFVYFIATNYRR